MNRYQPSHPRMAFGFVALAAAALNFGALVAWPAHVAAADAAATTLAAAAEPHVDSGRIALVAQARARRHDLIAGAVGAVEHATTLRLAGAPRWHLTEDKQ